MPDPCIFCGEPNEPSKEDVFAKWIRREFGDTRIVIKPSTYYPDSNLFKYAVRPKRGLGVISDKPCKLCNNRWMSVLENNCRTFIKSMMDAKHCSLNPKQQNLLARWFLKIVMMLEFKGDTSLPRYFTESERYALYKSGTIPDGVLIDIACRRKTNDTHRYRAAHLEVQYGQSLYGYTATLSIKQFAIQLGFVRDFQLLGSSWPPIFPPLWRNAVVELWPSPGTVIWPPPVMLNATMFELFIGRWQGAR